MSTQDDPQRKPQPPADDFQAPPVPPGVMAKLTAVAAESGVGGAYEVPAEHIGAIGFTHFDAPGAEDNTVTILLSKENMGRLPMQSLVRIKCAKDGNDVHGKPRDYLGVVVGGPFAEPDGLRADASLVVSTTVAGHGQVFLPRYHGRAFVQIMGEEVAAAQTIPPRFRPRPNSPVFPLTDDETETVYKAGGDARIGTVIGHERIVVGIPTDRKSVLPRHTGILGTTGGGKSTTVAGLVYQLQAAQVATILIDVEGEYTEIDQPTNDSNMQAALDRRGMTPAGVSDLHVLHMVGRDTSRERPAGRVHPFSLRFAELSPHTVMEILDLPEAQRERFLKAYDTTRSILRELKVFPANREEEGQLIDLDELESGYPRMTLSHLIDVCDAVIRRLDDDESEWRPFSDVFRAEAKVVQKWAGQFKTTSLPSWLGLKGKLGRINRLKIFDNPAAPPIRYAGFLTPGRTSVVDLSDTDEPQVRNLVIADILRGVQREQEEHVRTAQAQGVKPTPTVVIIEEAHEFLSDQRIKQMPVLFQQVARIAKRGRKRWLGLCFVTQLPQHLPDEVLGLLNNWVIHKISDGGVIDRLRKSVSGLDRGQWGMVPGLAPGQAVVSLTSMTRPLLVSVDPTPCRLRLVE